PPAPRPGGAAPGGARGPPAGRAAAAGAAEPADVDGGPAVGRARPLLDEVRDRPARARPRKALQAGREVRGRKAERAADAVGAAAHPTIAIMQPEKSVVRYRPWQSARSCGWGRARPNTNHDARDTHGPYGRTLGHGSIARDGADVSRLRPADAGGAARAARRRRSGAADVRVPAVRRGVHSGRQPARAIARRPRSPHATDRVAASAPSKLLRWNCGPLFAASTGV